MIRLLIRFVIFLVAAGVGLLVAVIALPGLSVTVTSFIIDVAIFAVIRSVISPFILKSAARYARALVGATGLFSTAAALALTTWISSGLTITGIPTWLLATLIIWLVSMLIAFLLPFLILKGLLGAWLRNGLRTRDGNQKNPTSHLI
ncbi:MAG TPA: hypothetical protein VES01_02185 [Dermatophilaceae bacterium]|nr:hypothetical protein [Dermatophilaceae bacterium]